MTAQNVTLTPRTEQRIVVKHCVPVGMTPMDTRMFVYMSKFKPNCSMVLVFRWPNIFSDGCDDIKLVIRPKIVTKNATKSVREKLSENCRKIKK